MYYYFTQDEVWLENIGWPLLRDIAKFWTSRVIKISDTSYSINGVMPVDEWCDNDATKCGDIGVNNAVQTNSVAVVSLLMAAQVGRMFGFTVDPRWETIAKYLKINFNSTTQTHVQFDNCELLIEIVFRKYFKTSIVLTCILLLSYSYIEYFSA